MHTVGSTFSRIAYMALTPWVWKGPLNSRVYESILLPSVEQRAVDEWEGAMHQSCAARNLVTQEENEVSSKALPGPLCCVHCARESCKAGNLGQRSSGVFLCAWYPAQVLMLITKMQEDCRLHLLDPFVG